jgi:hypothetical protein
MPDAVTDGSQPSAGVSPPQSGNATPPAVANAGSEPNDADRNWKALREDRDYLRDRVTELETRLNASAANAPKPGNGTPQSEAAANEPATRKTLADFNFDEAKYEAYLEDRIAEQSKKAAREVLTEAEEKKAKEERATKFESKAAEFAKANPTYFEAVRNPRFVQSPTLIAEIMGSEHGPAVALELATNLDLTNKLNRMDAVGVAREVARIEARIEARASAAAAATNQIPGAAAGANLPDPPPKLDAVGDAGVKKDPAKMTDDEWWRSRQRSNRAKK